MRMKKNRWLAATAVLLLGCSKSLSGTYSDAAGVTTYAFSGKGNVIISVLGANVDAEYRLDGDKILVTSGQGTVVLTRRDDRLYGPMGLELVRRPE